MSEASAFWVVAPGVGELRSEVLAEPGPEQVLVQTLYSGVSRGTEALVFHGRVPSSEWQRMRAPYQVGSFPAPVKYGYSSVGRVLVGPGELLGKNVFCLYPHQTQYVVPSSAVLPLPAGLPPERAVLAANLETALNALWDAPVLIGDRVTVVGGGVVGALVVFLASRMPQVDVELVDTNPSRALLAEQLGARFAAPGDAREERDLVFHCSSSEAGLNTALELARPEATVVELSWYGDRAVHVELGRAFHVRRLKLCSSQVGTVSPNARPNTSYARRLALALELCTDPLLDALIVDDVPFAELPRRMPEILAPNSGVLCQRVRYSTPA